MMQDPELVFEAMGLKEGDLFMDIGCGTGDYSIHASKIVGETGFILALDVNEHILDELRSKADLLGLRNLRLIVHDATQTLPLFSQSVDVCLISTVLHSIGLNDRAENIISEVARVLKPRGRLVIIECKKERKGIGPPEEMRLSPDDIEELTKRYSLTRSSLVDLGYNYMLVLTKRS
jgi:ubiquinone/menaquinone biosynthesis C-methylase UbiE